MSLILYIVTLLVLLAGCLSVLIYGTVKKTKWGINFKRVTCPRCNEKADAIRIPQNRQQALWGGFTCKNCSIEIDKWGREIKTENR